MFKVLKWTEFVHTNRLNRNLQSPYLHNLNLDTHVQQHLNNLNLDTYSVLTYLHIHQHLNNLNLDTHPVLTSLHIQQHIKT